MKPATTSGLDALALTKCTCDTEKKFFGDDCAIDCKDAKFKGDGIDAAKRCNCADKTFYDKDATECKETCTEVPNS